MNEEEPIIRKIIHIDMDAFFASVEQRDFPEYRDKPLVVGGSPQGGVVAAASYEARKYGIHSAMPAKIAYRRCPHLIFARPRFEVYINVSHQIRNIFERYTDVVQMVSIDEAYLDVTDNRLGLPSATMIAKEIKQEIRRQTSLTASAGVSYGKFLAKVASEWDKPDGLKVITPDEALQFLEELSIHKFRGIGRVTAERLLRMGFRVGADLKRLELYEMIKLLGKAGPYYYNIVRGIDHSRVRIHHIRKSVGAQRTFLGNLTEESTMLEKLHAIADGIWERMEKRKIKGKTVTLKIKYHDFSRHTHSHTLHHYLRSVGELLDIITDLLRSRTRPHSPVRLLGISISNLNTVTQGTEMLQCSFEFSG